MSAGFVAYANFTNADKASAKVEEQLAQRVKFDAASYTESDQSVAAKSKTIAGKNIDFSVSLEQPGDRYAAMINIVNDDLTDGIISEIVLSELDEDIAPYVDYYLSFDGQDYIGTSYNVNSLISRGANGRKQMFINVVYKDNSQNVGPINLDLSAGFRVANN